MPKLRCYLCDKWSPSKAHYAKVPSDYRYVCTPCRSRVPPDFMRCIATNTKKQQCKQWVVYRSHYCGIHGGEAEW